VRKWIEQGFGWIKAVGGLRSCRWSASPPCGAGSPGRFAAYNLIRLGGVGEWWESSST